MSKCFFNLMFIPIFTYNLKTKYMNFYEKCEEILRRNGWDIGQKYDWNEETYKEDPNLKELVFGVYVDNEDGDAWDICWDTDGYFVATWIGESGHVCRDEDCECDEEEEEEEEEDREDESGETLEELMLSL